MGRALLLLSGPGAAPVLFEWAQNPGPDEFLIPPSAALRKLFLS